MKRMITRSLGIGVLLAAGSLTLTAGENPKTAQTHTPLITDWSTRHVIFSHPRTPEQAARVQNDVRYQQQLQREYARPLATLQVNDPQLQGGGFWRRLFRRRKNVPLHRDWSWDLGPTSSVGAGNFPAKYSFSTSTANCISAPQPDFVIFSTGVPGASGQASIMALSNLYAKCTGLVPSSYGAYNTGGQVPTSPALSFDGTQVAFMQTTGGVASLVLMKWASGGTVQTPLVPTSVSAASYPACTAPCMTTFALGSANDTNSSVFYDFGTDTAWVGDDSGNLHQFTGVFKGTPAEATSGWPVIVSGNKLTSPVHNSSTGDTFVGDSGGFLYRVSIGGTVTASGRLDFGTGFTDGPVLDSLIGAVYVFSSKDAGTSAGVFQLSTSFAGGTTGTEAAVGSASGGTTPIYRGAFDHNYIFSPDSTGNLYVCGNPGAKPTIYQIPISAGTLGTALAGPVLSNTPGTPCSPAVDIYNPNLQGAGRPQEWVFASVHANGTVTACGTVACIMSFKVTQWQPSFQYNLGQEVLDSNGNIEVCENSGATSGTGQPTWGTNVFDQINDNGVHWRNQGPLVSTPANPNWSPGTVYSGAAEIIDSNNNIEIAEPTGGTSGATTPSWASGEGQTTTDNTVTWFNLGANPVAGLPATGGTSGIILDNLVNAQGTSQVYFSTLNTQLCGGNGTSGGGNGRCAVQASQQGLN